MTDQRQFISDIAATVDLSAEADRGAVLQRLTNHFMRVATSLEASEIDMFDMVFLAISREGDEDSRVKLSQTLASSPLAPRQSIRHLASDDAISVAGPVLRRSTCLDDDTLVEIASTKGQDHLLAISFRESVSPPVTNVITIRGDAPVLHVLLGNPGARFSDEGAIRVCGRAFDDEVMLSHVKARRDLDTAFAHVAAGKARDRRAQGGARSGQRDINAGVFAAVDAAIERGALDEALRLVAEGARVPHRVVARAFATDPLETFVVLARGADIGWDSVRAMLIQRLGVSASDASMTKAENLFADMTRPHALRTAHILSLRDRELYN
jgi:hypothetical protein